MCYFAVCKADSPLSLTLSLSLFLCVCAIVASTASAISATYVEKEPFLIAFSALASSEIFILEINGFTLRLTNIGLWLYLLPVSFQGGSRRRNARWPPPSPVFPVSWDPRSGSSFPSLSPPPPMSPPSSSQSWW